MKIEIDVKTPEGFEATGKYRRPKNEWAMSMFGSAQYFETSDICRIILRKIEPEPVMPEDMAACLRYMFGVGRWVAWDKNGYCNSIGNKPDLRRTFWQGDDPVSIPIPLPDGMTWDKSAMEIPPEPKCREWWINDYTNAGHKNSSAHESESKARRACLNYTNPIKVREVVE